MKKLIPPLLIICLFFSAINPVLWGLGLPLTYLNPGISDMIGTNFMDFYTSFLLFLDVFSLGLPLVFLFINFKYTKNRYVYLLVLLSVFLVIFVLFFPSDYFLVDKLVLPFTNLCTGLLILSLFPRLHQKQHRKPRQ